MTITKITIGPVPHSKGTWSQTVASTTGYKKDAEVFHNGSTFRSTVNANSVEPSFTYDSSTGVFTCSAGWELVAVGTANDIINSLLSGSLVPAFSGTIKSWADRNTLSVEDTWTGAVRTAAGDVSIDSGQKAQLLAVVARERFYASAVKLSRFNLLGDAIALGSGYYFLVPDLPFGTFGTAVQPNGVLFTNSAHENMTPTVRFKALADGVPTAVNDGSPCSYIDSNGYRFFTTPGAGYMIVDGITYAETCPHIAWSGRYDDFEAPAAGSSIDISGVIHKIHSYDSLLAVGGVADSFAVISKTQAQWTRRCDRALPDWTTVANEDGTYTHSAAIATMKADGAAQLEDGTPLSVSGTTVSYTDDQLAATAQRVEYILATNATGTEAISPLGDIEDFGLEMFVGLIGSADITMAYAQGYNDSVAALVNGGLDAILLVVAQLLASLDARIGTVEGYFRRGVRSLTVDNLTINNQFDRHDSKGNVRLEGEGSPNVIADFVGQRWKDTLTGEWWTATGTTAVSQWEKDNNAS